MAYPVLFAICHLGTLKNARNTAEVFGKEVTVTTK